MADDPQEQPLNTPSPSRELARQGILGGEDVNRALALELGMEFYSELITEDISPEILKRVPYGFVKKHTILPLKEVEGEVVVALSDPLKIEPLEELRVLLGKEIRPVYSPRESIQMAMGE